jgi:peptidoglycan hydrolase-like protein with peptidoglycan-binding domain
MNYTNAQFRSILNGLGHKRQTSADGLNFPISNDNSPLTDALTVQAVKKFQTEYKLVVDGIAGPITMNKAEQVIRILQTNLNSCVNAGLPSNQPFYGPLTTAAVKSFQKKIYRVQNGVADYELRVILYDFVKNGACPL